MRQLLYRFQCLKAHWFQGESASYVRCRCFTRSPWHCVAGYGAIIGCICGEYCGRWEKNKRQLPLISTENVLDWILFNPGVVLCLNYKHRLGVDKIVKNKKQNETEDTNRIDRQKRKQMDGKNWWFWRLVFVLLVFLLAFLCFPLFCLMVSYGCPICS